MLKKDKNWAGEKVIIETRPNFILGNKKSLIAVIILGILFYIYSIVRRAVVNFSLDLKIANFTQLPLTRIVTIIFLLIGFILFVYIIYNVGVWFTYKYRITTFRIITEKGLIRKTKSSMPFNTIQDIQIEQGILGRLIGIGSVLVYSAYDGNNIELSQVSNPQELEEIMFDKLQENRVMQEPISPVHTQYSQSSQDYQEPVHTQYSQSSQDYQKQINPQQNNHNNLDNNERYSANNFNYSTNTHTLSNEGNFQNKVEEPTNYTTEEFNNSINEAIKNLNGDIRFQQQREPKFEKSSKNNMKKENIKTNEPHNLYDDSIKETYSSEKEKIINYHDDVKYDDEFEGKNIIERHKSKFNKHKK